MAPVLELLLAIVGPALFLLRIHATTTCSPDVASLARALVALVGQR
jgi:hypothetical protein